MTFKTQCQIAQGRIDPAPMVDIVFLLLIFLVLSSPYVLQPGIGTVVLQEIPKAPNATWQGVVVTVARNNLLFFNDQATTIEGLRRSLQLAAQKSRNQAVIIRADQEVPNGKVLQIMSMAAEAGFSVVNQATRPEISSQMAPK